MKSYTMNPPSIIRLIKGTPKSGDPINIVEYNPEGFPTRIVYNIIGDTTEELIVAYGPNDGPIINGIEYKSHAINISNATLEVIDYKIVIPALLDLVLSNDTVDETVAINTVVGTFTATGGDAPYGYAITSALPKFRIDQDILVVDESLDGANNPQFVKVMCTDINGSTIERTFEINIIDNPEITDIELSNESIIEDDPTDNVVAIITSVGGTDPVIYEIEDDPTNSFYISGNELRLSRPAQFIGAPLPVSIKASDNKTREYTEQFDIVVIVPPYSSSKSVQFRGIDEYMRIYDDPSIDLTTQFTVSFWVKFSAIENNRVLLGKYDSSGGNKGFKISTNSNGASFIFLSEDGTSDDIQGQSSNFVVDVWYHVVFSFEANNKQYYIDGLPKLASTTTPINSIYNTTADFVVAGGLSNNNPSGLSKCFIDELSIYNRMLTDEEVAEIYNGGAPKNLQELTTEPDLVSWLKMGEKDTAPTITDVVGDNDGNLINMDSTNIVEDAP